MADNDQRMKDLELLYNAGQLPEQMRRDYELVRGAAQKEPEGTYTGAAKQLAFGLPTGFGDVIKQGVGLAATPLLGPVGGQLAERFMPEVDFAKDIGVSREQQPPHGFLEKAARTTGEFIGNPLSWIGPEGWGAKALSAVAGGVGSEALGEVGKEVGGDTGEFVGRVAGGAAGGGTIGAAERARLMRREPVKAFTENPNVQVPYGPVRGGVQQTRPQRIYHQPEEGGRQPLDDENELRAEANRQYNSVRRQPIQLTPQENNALFTSVLHDLTTTHDTSRRMAPTTFGEIDDQMHIGNTAAINSTDILGLHNRLGKLSQDTVVTNPTESRTAMHARELLRDWLMNNLTGNKSVQLRNAIGNWAAMEKISDVRRSLETALDRAAVSGSNKNAINTMRQEIRKIIVSDKRSRGYSQEAENAADEIVRGTPLTNTARSVAKTIPFANAWAILHALFTAKVSVPLMGLIGVTYAGRQLGDFLTRRQINRLIDILQREAPANRWRAGRNRLLEERIPSLGGFGAARGGTVGAMTDSDYLKSARKAPDGKWYVPDPQRPGKYLEVVPNGRQY